MSFTKEMIQDQELLVSTMSQRGMPEDLIRRQFSRLLEEQSKQLRSPAASQLEKSASLPGSIKSHQDERICRTGCCQPSAKTGFGGTQNTGATSIGQRQQQRYDGSVSLSDCDAHQHGATHGEDSVGSRKLEPSSLIRIRLTKELVEPQKRNNGLQEPTEALSEMIKKCKKPAESCNPCDESEPHCRLNGTQDKAELHSFLLSSTANLAGERGGAREKSASANGLDNAHTGVAETPASKRCLRLPCLGAPVSVDEYPRQKRPNQQREVVTAEQAQHSVDDPETPATALAESTMQEPFKSRPKIQQDLEYYPEFEEPRMIGGFVYYARKSQFIPSQ